MISDFFSKTTRIVLTGAALFAVFVIFLALVQFSTPDIPDNDGFYHIKLAYLMRTQGLKPEFPWLPLTILNVREFYDHHFLFHAALIPFTFGDLRLGAKWAAVLFSSLAFLSVWWLLQARRFVEYFPAFALIFTVFAWADYWESEKETGQPRFPDRLGRFPASVLLQYAQHLLGGVGSDLHAAV